MRQQLNVVLLSEFLQGRWDHATRGKIYLDNIRLHLQKASEYYNFSTAVKLRVESYVLENETCAYIGPLEQFDECVCINVAQSNAGQLVEFGVFLHYRPYAF